MPRVASYKRIIVCCDGTWQDTNAGNGASPSNVAKIARLIAPTGSDKDGNLVQQVVSYYAGLGSGDLPGQKAIYGGLGWGLENDVVQIYDFVSNNFKANDELFFFGFSRGAYTVRSAAGLISDVGILSAIHMSSFDAMWKAYRARDRAEPFQNSEWYMSNKDIIRLKDIPIKVVGVFDTVGALGIPQWPWVDWLKKMGINLHERYEFHDTKLSGNVENAIQALALDEKRGTFPPTLWHKSSASSKCELRQCWFPGTHQNVGGQQELPLESTDRGEIGTNTLAFMIDNVSGMLTFENSAIDTLLEDHRKAISHSTGPAGWGCGWIIDNFAGWQGKVFQLLGQSTRTPGGYAVQDTVNGDANESMHPMVRYRKHNVPSWKPPSLEGFRPATGPDGHWTFSGRSPVPEYPMSSHGLSVMIENQDGSMEFGFRESLARSLCPQSVLEELGISQT